MFQKTQVGDAGLMHLSGQRGLVTLLLDKCAGVTDAGTVHLAG